jgi:folate-dependent phosphoribosylglycinamide formyltransferase PurN
MQAEHLAAVAEEQRCWAQQVALELAKTKDAADLVERQKNAGSVFEVFFLTHYEGTVVYIHPSLLVSCRLVLCRGPC